MNDSVQKINLGGIEFGFDGRKHKVLEGLFVHAAVDGHSFGLNTRFGFGGCGGQLRVGPPLGVGRGGKNDFLKFGGQGVELFFADNDVNPAEDMFGFVDEFLNFKEGGAYDKVVGILLALDDAPAGVR